MRGKAHGCHLFPPLFGITPAYAGKRGFRFFLCSGFWDHPRLCGEKFRKLCYKRIVQGSPPPMRGKAFLVQQSILRMRITPAYAGKS